MDSDKQNNDETIGLTKLDQYFKEEPEQEITDYFEFCKDEPQQLSNLTIVLPCTIYCTKCGDAFDKLVELEQHLAQQHQIVSIEQLNYDSIDKDYKCKTCNKILEANFTNFFLHEMEHDNELFIICKNCSETFSSYDTYHLHDCIAHDILLKPKAELIYRVCWKCSKKCDNIFALRMHFTQDHLVEGSLDCMNMEVLGNSATSDIHYKCLECELVLSNDNWSILKVHTLIHLSVASYGCKLCKHIEFDCYQALRAHIQEQHVQKPLTTCLKKNVQQFKLHCSECDAVHLTFRKLFQHFSKEHQHLLEECFKKKFQSDVYECKLCGLLFQNQQRYWHLKDHGKYKVLECQVCNARLPHKFHMKHVRACTSEQTRNSKPSKLQRLIASRLTSKGYNDFVICICPVCCQEFLSVKLWRLHIQQQHDFFKEKQLNFTAAFVAKAQCLDCGKIVKNNLLAKQHHKFFHLPFKSFKCKLCNLCTRTSADIIKHLRKKHFALGEFECVICTAVFKQQFKLYEHCVAKHAVAEYPHNFCLVCNMQLKSEVDYKAHLERHEYAKSIDNKPNVVNDVVPNTQPMESIQMQPLQPKIRISFTYERAFKVLNFSVLEFTTFACPQCNLLIDNFESWRLHVTQEHSFFEMPELKIVQTTADKFSCLECNVSLNQLISQHQRHKLTHMPYKGFLCKLCNHRSHTLCVLVKHMCGKHFKKAHFQCNICAQVYETQYKLVLHVQKEHNEADYPPNFCKVCALTLSTRYNYATHMRSHDFNAPMFKCDYCPLEFGKEQTYKTHMKNKHSSELHKCRICSQSYSDFKQVEEHIKAEHTPADGANLAPTICKYCHYKVTDVRAIQLHISKMHSERFDLSCEMCDKKFSIQLNLRRHLKAVHQIYATKPSKTSSRNKVAKKRADDKRAKACKSNFKSISDNDNVKCPSTSKVKRSESVNSRNPAKSIADAAIQIKEEEPNCSNIIEIATPSLTTYEMNTTIKLELYDDNDEFVYGS